MAGEIRLITRIRAVNGSVEVEGKVGAQTNVNIGQGKLITWVGNRHSADLQDVGTAIHELVEIGADIATPGFGMFRNVSTANFIELGLVAEVAATPAAPTVAPQGATGAASYSYRVSAVDANGETLAGTAGTVAPIATPAAPTVAPQGASGAAPYSYRISAVNALGETLASTAGTTSTGNGTLSGTNFNRLTWAAVTGATGYKVYGRTGGSELLMATLGNVLTYDDTGAATPAGALPAANTTGANATLTGANFNRLTWAAVTFATGYKVYGRTSGGELLIATLGNVLTFDDTGAVTPAGGLPAVNSTGFKPFARMGPDEPAGPYRLKSRTLYAKSVGGACQLDHKVLEA